VTRTSGDAGVYFLGTPSLFKGITIKGGTLK